MTFYCSVSETIFRRENRRLFIIRTSNALRYASEVFWAEKICCLYFVLFSTSSVGLDFHFTNFNFCAHICHHRHCFVHVPLVKSIDPMPLLLLGRMPSFRWLFSLRLIPALFARVALFGSLCSYIIAKYSKAQRVRNVR